MRTLLLLFTLLCASAVAQIPPEQDTEIARAEMLWQSPGGGRQFTTTRLWLLDPSQAAADAWALDSSWHAWEMVEAGFLPIDPPDLLVDSEPRSFVDSLWKKIRFQVSMGSMGSERNFWVEVDGAGINIVQHLEAINKAHAAYKNMPTNPWTFIIVGELKYVNWPE